LEFTGGRRPDHAGRFAKLAADRDVWRESRQDLLSALFSERGFGGERYCRTSQAMLERSRQRSHFMSKIPKDGVSASHCDPHEGQGRARSDSRSLPAPR
jgi:hypothetical protein